MSRERTRQLALLELGIERVPTWRPHPALRHVVVRRILDGTEQRVSFSTPQARRHFLSEQRKARAEVRKESRRNLELKWMTEEHA